MERLPVILPPQSMMGTLSDAERDTVIKQSRIYSKYETEFNEISATELVEEENKKVEEEKQAEILQKEEEAKAKEAEKED